MYPNRDSLTFWPASLLVEVLTLLECVCECVREGEGEFWGVGGVCVYVFGGGWGRWGLKVPVTSESI